MHSHLPATIPEVVVNLTRLKDAFDSNQASALENTFRALFRNLAAVQQTIAQVVNTNADIAAWPVGSIFISIVSTNPNTLLGYGTWVAFGTGRTLVSLDSGNALMDTPEETFGSADAVVVTHNHTQDSHNHTQDAHSHVEQLQGGTTGATTGTHIMGSTATGGSLRDAGQSTKTTVATNQAATATNQATGESGTNKNYQPSIAVYMWKRTA